MTRGQYLRVIVFSLCLGSFIPTAHSQSNSVSEAKKKAIAFLVDQVGDDHLWHSEYYGNLKGGAGVSALALYAITRCEKEHWQSHQKAMQRTIDTLGGFIDKFGYAANRDGPDYSNYASSMLLIVTREADLHLSRNRRQALIDYLLRAQLDEEEGYQPSSVDFGGWDLSGWMKGKRRTTGTNISVSASVLEALVGELESLEKQKQSDPDDFGEDNNKRIERIRLCLQKGGKWLVRCGNPDGGFFFHPERAHAGNKAEWSNQKKTDPNSYGSATADGLRCMDYLGRYLELADSEDAEKQKRSLEKRIQKTVGWLDAENQWTWVPGFRDEEKASSWARGLKFYFWMSLSRTQKIRETRSKKTSQASAKMVAVICESQANDGSWQNKNARMREDDPLIATSFALIALNPQ